MRKKGRVKYLVIILSLGALMALLGFRVFQAVKSESQQARQRPDLRVQTVQTGVATRGSINEKITLVGSLKPKEQVDVSPKISGRIVEIKVDTGHTIKQGALIAVIEDDEIQQQVERARAAIAVVDAAMEQREAELNNAKAELDRYKHLVEAGLVSRQDFEAAQTRHRVVGSQLELARAQKRQAEAELRELRIRHEQTRIYSPITGVVSRRHVDVGAMVSPSAPIVTVVNVHPMVIQANAPERDVARIKVGSQATVTVDSLSGQQYRGRVMRISPILDPQTRNGLVEIEVENRGGALKGEMFARVELDLGTSRETILVPRDALVYRGQQPGVYVVETDIAKYRLVETGLTEGDKVEVLDGLKEGEAVITHGVNVIKDGDRIKVINARP